MSSHEAKKAPLIDESHRTGRTAAALLMPGPAALALAIFATFVVGVCAVNAVTRIGQPFPGFFFWENLFIPAVGEPSWSGVSAGLRYQSWLVEVDGRPVRDAREVEAALIGRRAGEEVSYRFEKGQERYDLNIPMMTLTPRVWASVLGIYVLDALVLLFAGLVVVYMKPTDAAARALFYFSTDLAFYLSTSADLFGPYLFRWVYFYALSFIPFTVCWLLSHFPVDRARSDVESRGLAALGLAAAALGTASNLAFARSHAVLLVLETVVHVLLAAVGLAAIVFFFWHFTRARSALTRARTQVVLLGTLGAFAPPVIALSVVFGLGVPVALNFFTITFVLFPLSIAYAIAKHDLFDVDRIIRRTIAYVLLSALVLTGYSLGISVVDYFLEDLTVLGSRIAQAVLILILVLLTSPSRDRIQDFVDRLYDRHRYSYRDVVRSASRAFATILDFEKLVSEALRLIDETLQPVRAELYTVDPVGNAQVRGQLTHSPGEEPHVAVKPLAGGEASLTAPIAVLATTPIVSTDRVPTNWSPPATGELLAKLDAAFVVPMTLDGRVVGLVAAATKRSGGVYTQDDYELVRTICDQLAVALENAQAYETIGLLNVDLETKNIELEDANREVREAQDELVRQERLAAVGELAGAVAHAIRNPLAGIKAAAQLAALDLQAHDAADTLRDVVSETDRLDERIGALLQFTRPFEPDLRPTSPRDVATQAVHDTAARAAARGVVVRTSFEAEIPLVSADSVLLEQAVLELLSNAIDASPDGGLVDVDVVAIRHDGTLAVAIEVVDSGPGISDRTAARIFDLFYTTKPRGTGFGLATVKKIVERHGGTIAVANREGRGAAFRITLPAVSGSSA